MKKYISLAAVGALVMGSALFQGCTMLTTEKHAVSDLRPQIAFRVSDSRLYSARVVLDGLDMGEVGAYLDGHSALRIQPGTHQLRVELGQQQLVNERFFVDDGVSRSFSVR